MMYTTFRKNHFVVIDSGSTQEKWEVLNLSRL
jgi:hypothetical protein